MLPKNARRDQSWTGSISEPVCCPVATLDYFQRIKGAIDSRIAEEQARQAKQQQASRPSQRRRLQPQDGHPPRASSRQPDATGVPPIKGPSPDPSEFEPDFAVGTDESNVVSRVGTPKPEPQTVANAQTQEPQVESQAEGYDGAISKDKDKEKDEPPAPSSELPVEVKVRLRKLDKLETKYQELLRAYRTAHARLQSVEPFEATLRENTPLTSISDPTALVEYLNQNKLKSDMVLDELTRVTGERDSFKKKFEQSEASIDALQTELKDLKEKHANSSPLPDSEPKPIPVQNDQADVESLSSPKSAASRIPSLSIFSPRTKPKEASPKEASEDLFSFDSEVPRLEAELQERQTEVEALTGQVNSLRGDLKVARESTEGMVQTLETTSKELNELRDAKERFEANEKQLQSKIGDLEAKQANTGDLDASRKELTELQTTLAATSAKLESAERNLKDLEAKNYELEMTIKQTGNDAQALNERLAQKDHTVKDLEDSLAVAKLAEKEHAQQVDQNKSSAKRLETMQGLLDAVRTKLDAAESTINELNLDLEGTRKDFETRPSTKLFGLLDTKPDVAAEIRPLTSRQELLEYVSANLGASKIANGESNATTTSVTPATEDATTSSSKKKNKKKKKAKGTSAPTDEVDTGVPVKVSENLSQEPDDRQGTEQTSQFTDLQAKITALEIELSQKREQIDTLNKRIKDQESLQEEIETLRDDLLHQGSEHVEARDALKSANESRKSLEETVAKLEADLAEVRSQQSSNTETANELATLRTTHEQTSKDLAELQDSHKALQDTLTTTEALSQSHQTNVTDLQTQLAALKEESTRLESAQQDLKNKSSEITRLESKHEETKLQLKNLANRLSTQDADLKSVQSKVEQETAARIRLEGELSTSQSDLRATEARRITAVETSESTSRELATSRTESDNLRTQIASLQDTISTQKQQIATLQSEIASKTALQKSTENVVQSLRSQTQELQTQYREVSGRAASVEEELSEAQRMLTERTREGQTMRMLLAQSESGTEARVREMRERMEKAVEERDRLEDESSLSSRRMARDADDAKAKLKDAQRQVKVLEAERDDLEGRTREWKRRKEELEEVSRGAEREVEEVREAMRGLREALDESERALRDAETQRAEIKRVCEEAQERVDKLEKGNKNLTDELRNLQLQVGGRRGTARAGGDSGGESGRTSIDSRPARSPAPPSLSRMGSGTVSARPETPSSGGAGLSQGTVDYVYLKNVLLQFLSQKDKAHQRQLIPVIGMLLHFDPKDEQRWNAAIAAR